VAGTTGFAGAGVLAGAGGGFGGAAVAANPMDEAGTFVATGAVLPPAEFPLFASAAAGGYTGPAAGPFGPVEGSWYVAGLHQNDSYMRLTRTVDLTGVTAAQAPTLRARLSVDTEPGFDAAIVEARTAGADDWTTLPVPGLSSTDLPAECGLLAEHPFLGHYLTADGATCAAGGTSGSWNMISGSSGGWQPAAIDLSGYAGKRVEVSISFLTDSSVGGVGVFVDDTALVVGAAVSGAEGFEAGLGPWAVAGAPAGSPPGGGSFARSQTVVAAAISTADTVLLGFGVEQLAIPAQRTAVLGAAVRQLIGQLSRGSSG
jgi:hypothetical protein